MIPLMVMDDSAMFVASMIFLQSIPQQAWPGCAATTPLRRVAKRCAHLSATMCTTHPPTHPRPQGRPSCPAHCDSATHLELPGETRASAARAGAPRTPGRPAPGAALSAVCAHARGPPRMRREGGTRRRTLHGARHARWMHGAPGLASRRPEATASAARATSAATRSPLGLRPRASNPPAE